MRPIATTKKRDNHYYACIVIGTHEIVFPEPFINRKTAFKHACYEVYERLQIKDNN